MTLVLKIIAQCDYDVTDKYNNGSFEGLDLLYQQYPGGGSRGAHPVRAPLKFEKICFFGVKS